ncbi:MAG: HD domain-containing protein [Bryobacterales bacterium]|nr:HD domain-containing protein [Bryobacteraceae bacterium]MDW8353640.1 HD domain-containing protein [Bryobacterales bacterium]
MKSPYVNELQPNQIVTATFLVHHKEIRQKKSGELYLSLLLRDRTGDLDAKMWDNVAEVMHTFEQDDFVRVKGLYTIYQNRPQLTIHKVERLDEAEVDPADFFPVSSRDPEEMFAELRQIVTGVRHPHLKALLEAFLNDPEIAARLKRAPAAKSVHHAYLGGLLEHVLSLCRLCQFAAGHYPHVDPDLLVTGAILHDIGKLYELRYDRNFAYTTEGQLLGHIAIGLRLIAAKLRDIPNFPERLRTLVEHMVLSHHGQLEYGSPKVPLFPEALLLHHLDDLDSKMDCMRARVDQDPHVEGEWTGYSQPLDRIVLKKGRYLEGPSESRRRLHAVPTPRTSQQLRAKAPTLFGEKLLQALEDDS